MKYISTNKQSPAVSFREAVLNGQPDDRGLYFPTQIPRFDRGFWSEFRSLFAGQIAVEVLSPYVGSEITADELGQLCAGFDDFDFPLVQIDDIFVLELFHGPTLSFKDVGAGFLSRCLHLFSGSEEKRTVVLVATSGDTGGAVAAAFAKSKNVDVVILYPHGGVSSFQENQLTTAGDNVHAVEIDGSFDDCQRLVKTAFTDTDLNSKLRIISANSINVARWLAQQVYYFRAIQQWKEEAAPVFCVPSGNFGNIAAGLLASYGGLPNLGFIAATNVNDTVPRYLQSGEYEPRPTTSTLSNAMDISDPSNLSRIQELFGNKVAAMRSEVSAIAVTDDETREQMQQTYKQHNYILDPHGAVGYAALKKYLHHFPGRKGIVLETAHPVKFESVEEIIGVRPEAPAGVVTTASESTKQCVVNDYESVRDVIANLA